jgi:hypothetical protein
MSNAAPATTIIIITALVIFIDDAGRDPFSNIIIILTSF